MSFNLKDKKLSSQTISVEIRFSYGRIDQTDLQWLRYILNGNFKDEHYYDNCKKFFYTKMIGVRSLFKINNWRGGEGASLDDDITLKVYILISLNS